MRRARRLPFGAECCSEGVRFRLYAPALESAAVLLTGGARRPMSPAGEGFFEALVPGLGAGEHSHHKTAPGTAVPDPASRFQPEDVAGPSEVIDAAAHEWTDTGWRGRPWREAVLYETHVGCFTAAGDFAGVAGRLDHLCAAGVTALELMPAADFPGRFNWGYDGVLPFAPDSSYGRPGDLKRLVEACHARGLMILLDVVYNHFGPSGNHLARYAPDFFHGERHTPWGAALAFDNPVLRRFFVENALYWLQEFHFDGLRLDAVHAITQLPGGETFLGELAQCVRDEVRGREVHLVLENDRNEAHWLPASRMARQYTAQWNDDFHHAAHVALTGEDDGYYADYADAPLRHLARCLAEGFDYQGETSAFRGGPRGEPCAGVAMDAFVAFLQNHDQVGNRAFGERLGAIAPPAGLRALYALLFLCPQVPLLFMGEEWAAATPFRYFCDFTGDLGEAVRAGRRREFAHFAAFHAPRSGRRLPDPTAEATFLRSHLDWSETRRRPHADWLAYTAELASCRRRELIPRLEGFGPGRFLMLGARAFVVEWPLSGGGTWQVALNLAHAAVRAGAPAGRVVFASPPAGGADLQPDALRVCLGE